MRDIITFSHCACEVGLARIVGFHAKTITNRYAGELHPIIAGGNERRKIFEDKRDCVDDGDRNVIPASIQWAGERTGQEHNQRKDQKGAYWEDRYHRTAVESDGSMGFRAAGEWPFVRLPAFFSIQGGRGGRILRNLIALQRPAADTEKLHVSIHAVRPQGPEKVIGQG